MTLVYRAVLVAGRRFRYGAVLMAGWRLRTGRCNLPCSAFASARRRWPGGACATVQYSQENSLGKYLAQTRDLRAK